MSITERKKNHIEVCLNRDVRSGVSNGFEKYRLIHNALPEADFRTFSMEEEFLGRKIGAPLLISSMTGGTELGERVNRNLAEAAESLRIPFAIGSQRVYLADEGRKPFDIRKYAPDVPVLANVGAVQLNHGFTRDHYLRAVEMIGADALILHLNPLQELVQKDGDSDFSGILRKIEALCAVFPVPIIAKEVGWGISLSCAEKLIGAGVSMIDVAGAGGTSWSKVERLVHEDPESGAESFDDWGIPTAECVERIHTVFPDITLIASGGITNGVEGAKAILLGAKLFGMAGALLPDAAREGSEAICSFLKKVINQYKIARFVSDGIEKT